MAHSPICVRVGSSGPDNDGQLWSSQSRTFRLFGLPRLTQCCADDSLSPMSTLHRYHQLTWLTGLIVLGLWTAILAVAPQPAAARPPADDVLTTLNESGPTWDPSGRRQCGDSPYGRRISIYRVAYVNCANARLVVKRYVQGRRLPPYAGPGTSPWSCYHFRDSYAKDAFGERLPSPSVDCAGFRGSEFVRFEPSPPVQANCRIRGVKVEAFQGTCGRARKMLLAFNDPQRTDSGPRGNWIVRLGRTRFVCEGYPARDFPPARHADFLCSRDAGDRWIPIYRISVLIDLN